VIVVLPYTAPMMYMRQLPFTAITRAKKHCIVISVDYAIENYLKSDKKMRRNSNLANFLAKGT
jgi:ATP-dependent exoDNAse (exonuclease V) alpha subunit